MKQENRDAKFLEEFESTFAWTDPFMNYEIPDVLQNAYVKQYYSEFVEVNLFDVRV